MDGVGGRFGKEAYVVVFFLKYGAFGLQMTLGGASHGDKVSSIRLQEE